MKQGLVLGAVLVVGVALVGIIIGALRETPPTPHGATSPTPSGTESAVGTASAEPAAASTSAAIAPTNALQTNTSPAPWLALPSGFDEFTDQDQDGAVDALLVHSGPLRNLCERASSVWGWLHYAGPTLLAHRVQQHYLLDDSVARSYRSEACANSSGEILVKAADGLLDVREAARRTLCQVASGAEPETLLQQLEPALLHVENNPRCDDRDEHVHLHPDVLRHWLKRLARVRRGELDAQSQPAASAP